MDPLDDIRIDPGLEQPDTPEPPPPRTESWHVVGIVAAIVVVVALVAAYFWFRRPATDRPVASTQQAAQSAADVRGPLGPPVDAIELPPLFLTDPLVRDLIGRLSSHPEVMAWLATDGLIRNLVACLDNVASGQSPARHLARQSPRAPFRAVPRSGAFVLDQGSYARYTGIADAVASLDPAGLARVYSMLKPRMVDAYRELGHPEGDIDAATERAISVLLQAPVIEGEIALIEKVISYKFQKEELEALEPAQKHLLRMGPRNQRVIQDQLRAIARELGVPDKRLPARPGPAAAR
ncbi:MAG: DUF3014 domain-containing protein [Acidobacteria bacterium]|nr:DUF3014 domain-containing protein [Acidobacteriota bacterium]